MQSEQSLLEVGFTHYPAWDFKDSYSKGFRMAANGNVFRARIIACNGPIPYVQLGKVISDDGKVNGWRDCCSKGSVARKISDA